MHSRLIAFILGTFLAGNILAQDTLRVLFVGNSYIYMSDIPTLTSKISAGTDTYIVSSESTAGGARLSNHWYGKGDLKTKQMIADGDYDYVILQEQSMGTIQRPVEFYRYVKLFAKFCRKKGSEPVLYQTWARANTPNTQEQISSAYQKTAQENNALLAPIGDAWSIVRKQSPELELYLEDGSHQSEIGAFIAACTVVKVLSGELPDIDFLSQMQPKLSSEELTALVGAVHSVMEE